MKVYRGLSELKLDKSIAVTTGMFDGVHLGHEKVLMSLKESAKKHGCESLILTFDSHPRIVLQQNTDLKLLSSLDEKISLLENQGIDHLLILPFTKEFSRLSSLDFVRKILVGALGTSILVIGHDHHFGRNREGSFKHLQEFGPVYGFEVEEIPAKDVEEVNVSSTKVRTALLNGEVKKATSYLGYNYQLAGKVVKGQQIGASLGFPTANMMLFNAYKLVPQKGVYAVDVFVEGEKHKGMLNIGVRPTVDDRNDETIEVHIFDFDKDIYDYEIQISFLERIRDEKKFESTAQLEQQLKMDKLSCLKLV